MYMRLIAPVTEASVFCTPEWAICTSGEADGASCPQGCTKLMDPVTQRAAIVLLYQGYNNFVNFWPDLL